MQRDDDTEGVILHRMEEYEAFSAPLIDYYKTANYHRVTADRDVNAIAKDLLSALSMPARFTLSSAA